MQAAMLEATSITVAASCCQSRSSLMGIARRQLSGLRRWFVHIALYHVGHAVETCTALYCGS